MLPRPQHQKRRARVLLAWSITLVLAMLPCFAGVAHWVMENGALDGDGVAVLAMALGVVLAAIALGMKARQIGRSEDRLDLPEDLERYVLGLAQKRDGELSATVLAMKTKLNLEQSMRVLAEFEKRGHAYPIVVGESSQRYVFPDLKGGQFLDAQSADADDFMRRLAESNMLDEQGDEVEVF